MATTGDQHASGKGKPVTVVVHCASGSITSSVRPASSVESVESGTILPFLESKTSPGTVLIVPQGKASSAGGKKAVGTKPTGKATAESPSQNSGTLPSRYKVSKPQRMVTRSRGKSQEEEPSAPSKRKLPAKSGRTASGKGKSPKKAKVSLDIKVKGLLPKKAKVSLNTKVKEALPKKAKVSQNTKVKEPSPNKAKVSLDTKVKETSLSRSKTVPPKKRVSQQKSADTSHVISKPTVQPETSPSNVGKSSGTVDIKVKFTPSEGLLGQKPPSLSDHSYHATPHDFQKVHEFKEKVLKDLKDKRFDATYSSQEVQELSEKAHKDAKMVEKLTRDRKMLRMRVFRANKKIEKLMRTIQLEQKMHKETQQTLQAIMQGLQLQVQTVER